MIRLEAAFEHARRQHHDDGDGGWSGRGPSLLGTVIVHVEEGSSGQGVTERGNSGRVRVTARGGDNQRPLR